MKIRSTMETLALISLIIASSGCAELPDEEVGVADEDLVASNALTVNALTINALTTNALTTNALTTNALTTNALTTNGLIRDALRDSLTREFFSYLVSCALPQGARVDVTIDGVTYGFNGQIGIFPQWGTASGTCDTGCKNWVSGCVLSRVNYLGVHVPISIRGNKAPLVLGPTEMTDYPKREATYYGNVFSSSQIRYACLSPGATSDTRVCGSSLAACVMKVVGSCDSFCGPAHTDGAFPNCRDMPRDPVTGLWPANSNSYPGSITVFLQ
jgi:hypothetical protein